MPYSIPTAPCQATLEIKKSQFLGFGYPIDSREQAMFHVEQLHTRYADARHICWAYIIGEPTNTTSAGFDDDGEPSGTAGKPILNVLQYKALGNCLIAVVRYFGGIKLGAGGLTRAYSGTAQAVVENMTLTPFIATATLTISTDFANESFIRHLLAGFHVTILTAEYSKVVRLTVEIAEPIIQRLTEKIGFYGVIKSVIDD